MNDTLKEHIIAIAKTGLTNMFHTDNVKFIADSEGWKDVIKFIDTDPEGYFNFIMFGNVDGAPGAN